MSLIDISHPSIFDSDSVLLEKTGVLENQPLNKKQRENLMKYVNHSLSKSIYNKHGRSMGNSRYKSQELSPTIEEGPRKKLFNKQTQPEHRFSIAFDKSSKSVNTAADINEMRSIFNRKKENDRRFSLAFEKSQSDIAQQKRIFGNRSRQRNFSEAFSNPPQLSSPQTSEVRLRREVQEGQQMRLFGNQRVVKRNFSEAFSDPPLPDHSHSSSSFDNSDNPHNILTSTLKNPQTNSPNSDLRKRASLYNRRMSYFMEGIPEIGDEPRENVSISANTD